MGEIWQHQRDAVDFAKARRGSLLAMPMGTGKSRVVVELVRETGASRILISAPKSVVPNWAREFEKHAPGLANVVTLDRGTMAKRAAKMAQVISLSRYDPKPLVVVWNHDVVWRTEPSRAIDTWSPDLVVVDESHKIKSPFGKASKWFGQRSGLWPRRVALTGTPMPHSPLDIFAQYRFLEGAIYGRSWVTFRSRYARMGGFQMHQVIGYQNTEEFARKYRQIAYECDENVVSLPETLDTTIPVELEPKVYKLYRELERDFYARVAGGEITVRNALTKALRLAQLTGGAVTLDSDDEEKHVEIVSTAKQDALQELLEDTNEPIVVFCRFRADLDSVHRAASNSGRQSLELSGVRNELEEWQRSPAPIVLAVQIQAGGVGIDLTKARIAVYFSLGYSLGEYLQSRKRTHRPGQDRKCLYIHLVASHTIDQKIYKALERRQDVIRAILNPDTSEAGYQKNEFEECVTL